VHIYGGAYYGAKIKGLQIMGQKLTGDYYGAEIE
jgi:hypothetical protein